MSRGAPRRPAWALAVALCAAAPYAGTLGHGFAFDDGPEVVANEAIRSLSSLPSLFATSAWKGAGEENPLYRPITTASYALNYAAGGLAPFGYHLANLLLHVAVSLLLLALARALGLSEGAAAFAALLFAVHPVHAEVVANVAGRKDALATALLLLAVLAHGRAVRRGGGWLVAPPLALAAAMLSKESALVGIGLLAARDLLVGREEVRRAPFRAAALHASYLALVVAYFGARALAVGHLGVPRNFIPFSENPLAQVAAPTRLFTALSVLGRGLALLVAPLRLSPDYSFAALPLVRGPGDGYLLLAVSAFAFAGYVASATWRRRPIFAFALAWYACAILPGSNLLVAIGTIFGERLLYLPSVGFCLAAGGGFEVACRRAWPLPWRRLALAGAAALLALFGARAYAYAGIWRDELTLFSAGVSLQPESGKMRQCLGGALMEHGRAAEAAVQFEALLRIMAGAPEPLSRHRLELGVAYERSGRLEEAAALYRQTLRDDPGYADARWRLGDVLWAEGRRAEAIAAWRQTLELEPRHAQALSDLGIAYAAQGDAAAAIALWERATAADPRLAMAWYRLGAAYARAGDLARARDAWRQFQLHSHGRFEREEAEVAARLAGQPPK